MLLVLIVGVGYIAGKQKAANDSADVASVIGTSIGFGQSMHKVSLLAPQADYEVAVDQAYTKYASPDIIAQWKLNPSTAPGTQTSSPWPQGIEIISNEKQTDGSYVVQGNVLEVTSVEAASGGYSGKYPVTLTLQKIKGTWLITGYTRGAELPNTNATSTQ